MNRPTCRTCQYAEPVAGGPIVGQNAGYECRRQPPAAFPAGGPGGAIAALSVFPPVKPDQWCGEHSTREGEANAAT